MICKVCGTNNEDYLEYCKKCSAPLHGSDNADNGAEAPASPRSFVRSPVWAKPEFNANTISENDIPADFLNGKAEETAQPAQPAQQPRQSAPNPQQTQLFTDIHGDAPFRLLSVHIDAKFRNTKLKAVKKWFSETKPQSGIH